LRSIRHHAELVPRERDLREHVDQTERDPHGAQLTGLR
jgi:hypothetical protein